MICESTSRNTPRLKDTENGEVTKELKEPSPPAVTISPPGQTELSLVYLDAGEVLTVNTNNSQYRIVILDPVQQMVIIRGGRFFSKPTEAKLLGSSADKKVRIGKVVIGRGLAVAVGRRCFVTSPVKEVLREGH